MPWIELKDVFLVLLAAVSGALYAFRRSGWYVYPATPVGFAIIWEALGWSGLRSAAAFGLVLLIVVIAMAIRLARHRPVLEWTSSEPIKDFLLVWAACGVSLVAMIVIGVMTSLEQ